MSVKNKSKFEFKNIKFLITIFACLFGVLGGISLPIILSKTNSAQSAASEKNNSDKLSFIYTTEFRFKQSTLEIYTDTISVTSFLLISNPDAITNYSITGNSIDVSLSPCFTIFPLCTGQSIITISATIKSGEIETISTTILVKNRPALGESQNTNNESEPPPTNDSEESDTFVLSAKRTGENELVFSFIINGIEQTAYELESDSADFVQLGTLCFILSDLTQTVAFKVKSNPEIELVINLTNFAIGDTFSSSNQ